MVSCARKRCRGMAAYCTAPRREVCRAYHSCARSASARPDAGTLQAESVARHHMTGYTEERKRERLLVMRSTIAQKNPVLGCAFHT